MHNIVIHPTTAGAIERAISQHTQAIILNAPAGAGKSTIARLMATSLLGIQSEDKLRFQPYFRHVGADEPLNVETVRDIKQFLSLKTTGAGTIRRVAIIDHAEAMNDESQNALLKTLEEPPLDTVLILCADDDQALRSTIRSRSQTIQILPPPRDLLNQHFASKGFSAPAIEKAYRISGGYVGLMQAILDEDLEHPLVAHIEQAKQLLGATQFDRLRQVDEIAKQKDSVRMLLFAFRRISSGALEQAALKSQTPAIKRWHGVLQSVSDAEAALRFNPNMKLLLTDLFIHI